MDIDTKRQIEEAANRIAPHVRQTPLLEIKPGEICNARVMLKLESLQVTGSFKARGAFNTLLQCEHNTNGVIAASGGNHGIAVANAAKTLGLRAEIFVPEIASPIKVARLLDLGAKVYQTGQRYADSLAAMQNRQAETGAVQVHAFDQREVLIGQATLAREFENTAPPLDMMIFAVGGGGLIGGAMMWLGERLPLKAVEPRLAPTLASAIDAGRPVDVEVSGLAADSLGAKRIGQLSFELAKHLNPQTVLVEDDEIKAAQRWLFDHCRILAEPGGVAALAAVLSGRLETHVEQTLGIVICGGNAELSSLA